MKKFIGIIKKHRGAIILAVLTGIIVAYPQIHFRYQHSNAYEGQAIEILSNSPWAPLIQEMNKGNLTLASPSLKDGKDTPYLFQPLDTMVVAFSGKIFSLDLNNTLLFYRLFFAPLLFILIYIFVFLFSRDKLAALASSAMIMLGITLISRTGLWQILRGQSPDRFLGYFQPVIPVMPLLFFFGFLLTFWLFWIKRQWQWGVISTFLLGSTFYEYFYNWTFLFPFLGILVLICFFQKKIKEAKRVAMVFIGGLLIGIPYFCNLYWASLYSTYEEVGKRFGIVSSREPILGLLVPLVFIVFLLLFPRKWRERFYFGLALAITPFIVLNQQLITGKMMESGHYHWRYHLPLAIIFLLTIFFYWMGRREWGFIKKMVALFLISLSIYTAIFVQMNFYQERHEKILEKQRYGPILEWFNENSRKDEVVFADDELSYLIIVYTPLNVFYSPMARFSLAVSRERLLNSVFSYYRLGGVSAQSAQEVFFQEKSKLSNKVYGTYYSMLTGSYKNTPDEVIQDMVQKYQASFSVPTDEFLNKLWDRYEVRYVVWDKKTNPQWNLNQYSFLEKVAEIGDFIIYQNENSILN